MTSQKQADYVDPEEAVRMAMERMGWSKDQAYWELAKALVNGELPIYRQLDDGFIIPDTIEDFSKRTP